MNGDPAKHGKRIGYGIASCDARTFAPQPFMKCACLSGAGGSAIKRRLAPEQQAARKVQAAQHAAGERNFNQRRGIRSGGTRRQVAAMSLTSPPPIAL